MKKIFRLLLSIMFIGVALSMTAQQPVNPVKWRVNVKMTSQTEGQVVLTATIADGWHLYGMNLPKDGPKPTKIDFSGSKGIKFTDNLSQSVAPLQYFDKMFDLKLSCWEGKVVFRRSFKVIDRNNAVVAGAISFMSCNNSTCNPPTVETFNKKVVVK